MQAIKEEILRELSAVEEKIRKDTAAKRDGVSVTAYRRFVKVSEGREIWTVAFQKAIDENPLVLIPAGETPYFIDDSILIPSDRRIEAEAQARICLTPECKVLMFRNTETGDGTHAPIPADAAKNVNISINGGIWEESRSCRMGYGRSGMYDTERSFYGVSTCMLFNHLDTLSLTNMTFVHTAGFAVQTGDIRNALLENITFVECFADGLHINGNTENMIIRNIYGNVGDDLVALNMYDWQNSSVDFGPAENILCENIVLSAECRYPAMRIEPGTYFYADGSAVDCALRRAVIRNVVGVRTFKMYYQTPWYPLTEKPEKGAVGSGDHIYFENIRVDLNAPIDKFAPYTDSDSLRGTFAAFEIGANIGYLSFENIDIQLYRDKYPYSYFLCIGPKSVLRKDGKGEIFDPYLSSELKELHTENIRINGETVKDITPYIREIEFRDINRDGFSSGKGVIRKVING